MPDELLDLVERGAVATETERVTAPPTPPVRVYKTQLAAVAYLRDAGYVVSKSRFNRDVKSRRVPVNADGDFEEPALLGYAGARLSPAEQRADEVRGQAEASKLSADAELKSVQAARFRLKYEQEQGLLMPRADHERDLAARALFFAREVRNYIHLNGASIIALVNGDDDRLSELVRYWTDSTEVWMDAWAREREFILDTPDENEPAPQADGE
jgi:hypothetical protein